jgi:16S rRNA processing protein RimM
LASVEIGSVLGAHGLRGEVRVRLFWSASELLFDRDCVLLRSDAGEEERDIEELRRTPKGLLLKLEGVDDRDQAEALRGTRLCVPREELPALEEGEYYLCDLVGSEVVTPDGPLGRVVEVRIHPSVDAIVVQKADGSLVEQILGPQWVESVTAGKVVLTSTDGLIE